MPQKIRSAPYAGELPEIEHATISLRAQLRLSYETYAWLRYLSLAVLLLTGVLLILVPGGFPPPVFASLWHDLSVAGHLLVLHGLAAFVSLLALFVQALTWLVLWGLYLHVGRILILSTWRLYHTQTVLASGWRPYIDTTGQAEHDPSTTPLRTRAGDPTQYPARLGNTAANSQRMADASQRLGMPQKPAHPLAAPQRYRPALVPTQTQPVQEHTPALRQTQVTQQHEPRREGAQSPSAVLTRPAPGVEVATASSPRQFVHPTVPLIRPRATPAQNDPTTSTPHATATQNNASASTLRAASLQSDPFTSTPRGDWPALALTSEPGVAWDVGLTRKGRPNEDSVLTLRGACNFADRLLPFELHIVADGMGGHAHGRLASHLAIKGMLETVIPGLVSSKTLESEQIVDVLIDGVHWANQVIYEYGREREEDMGTTITAVLLLDELAYIINVGDSRTYVYRPDAGLTQITRDHSLVARLVETGAIPPDAIYTHPERNKVYRGLGDQTDVTVDWFILPVQVGDLLLLCSDGLWEMVRDPRITEILATYASAPVLASNALLRAALQAGGKDNVSLLVVRVLP